MDPLQTLGLPGTVTLSEARRAYRSYLRAFHPDTGSGDAAALAAVKDAYRDLERKLRAEAARPAPAPHVDVYA
jgi:curved DNA-binding protein CbpA